MSPRVRPRCGYPWRERRSQRGGRSSSTSYMDTHLQWLCQCWGVCCRPHDPQRSGVRAHVRARSGCAGVGGTRRRPRGAGRLARTDLNCPGGARSVSRAHSAAGAPTQIRGWAHARELAPAAGEGGGFTARRGALSCVRAGARAPNPHSPPAAGEGGGFTARRGRVSAQFLLALGVSLQRCKA